MVSPKGGSIVITDSCSTYQPTKMTESTVPRHSPSNYDPSLQLSSREIGKTHIPITGVASEALTFSPAVLNKGEFIIEVKLDLGSLDY
jgi:hypothetical protein